MSKGWSCALCRKDCRKRDIVCAKCWNGLGEKRREAIRLAPYSRDEKGKRLLNDLLTCDLNVVGQIVADKKVAPGAVKVDEDVEAVYTEINPA